MIIDNASVKFYSIIFRAKNWFEIEKMVTREDWQEHLVEKIFISFDLFFL